jgi:hypothetical protein
MIGTRVRDAMPSVLAILLAQVRAIIPVGGGSWD